ncbi:unnamed protein product [Phytophthora lilii]|uniref:Unnamed protein product n=1 Tax=Phytophthora lilii TaxID=2077276 RepID=A0A9W6TCN3_9STRA|nr:unnamed protein product [Phytophthora lilii]
MRSAVLVTGASRGFGRCLALDFARELATSDLDLQTGELVVVVQMVDLSDSADYPTKTDSLLAQLTSAARYDRVFLVHNAGALGALGFAQECPSPAVMARHFELNVTSAMWLNKRFLDVFGASRSEMASAKVSQEVADGTTTLTMRESPLMAPKLAKWFVEMKEHGTLVPTSKSSRRGVVVAVSGDFDSGRHVTFDELNYVDEP